MNGSDQAPPEPERRPFLPRLGVFGRSFILGPIETVCDDDQASPEVGVPSESATGSPGLSSEAAVAAVGKTTTVVDQGTPDVLLGTTGAGEKVSLPYDKRDLGTLVLGQNGFGKTTLLENLILHDIANDTAAVVLDAHGDLSKRLLELTPRDKADRVTYVSVEDDRAFGLNLLDCPNPSSPTEVERTVGGFLQIIMRLMGGSEQYYAANIEWALREAVRTIIANHGNTLLEIPRLFTDDAFRSRFLNHVQNQGVHEFWRWFEESRAGERMEFIRSTMARLSRFTSSGVIRPIVGQAHTTLPIRRVFSEGGVLLVSLPIGRLSQDVTGFLGSIVLCILGQVIYSQEQLPRAERRRVHIYLDEYGLIATPATADILTGGRKFGTGTLAAHQKLSDAPDEKHRGAELQVGNLIFFQLIGDDAYAVAGELDTTPVRTKKVLRQRTAPQYRYEPREVWNDEQARRRHVQLMQRLGELERSRIATGRLHDDLRQVGEWDRSSYKSKYEDLILTLPEDAENIHQLFSPNMIDYHYLSLRGSSATYVGSWENFFEPRVVCEVYKLPKEAARHARILTMMRLTHKDMCLLSLKSSSTPSLRKAALAAHVVRFDQLYNELEALLERLYEDSALFFFDANQETMTPERGLFMEQPVSPEGFKLRPNGLLCYGKSEEQIETQRLWLEATRPEVGTQRHLTFRPHRAPDDWPWYRLGWWMTTPFFEAVRWLKKNASAVEAEREQLRQTEADLKKEAEQLAEKYRRTVQDPIYLGEKPVRDEIVLAPERHMVTRDNDYVVPPVTREEQWYDHAEELDQTHEERRREIANELATLPRFTAYCQVLDAAGKPTERRITTLEPPVVESLAAREAILERSSQFMRPVRDVQQEIQARQEQQDGLPAGSRSSSKTEQPASPPPTGPIGRRRPTR